jgi:excisionase family DNA binding protein
MVTRQFLSVKEVAEILGVSDMTITRQIKLGRLSAVRVGHRLQISHSALDDYLRRNAVGAPQTPAPSHDTPNVTNRDH